VLFPLICKNPAHAEGLQLRRGRSYGPVRQSRDVLLLLSVQPSAGVYDGLDSKRKLDPDDPPAARLGGFFIFVVKNGAPM
jgi:hypothetical protein